MERYEDIVELLEAVEQNIRLIDSGYESARNNDEQKTVLRPLVKTSLEHLRSILEYSAQDIWGSYNSKEKILYFPYGSDKANFEKNINKNLPNLKEKMSAVYSLIESLQPHSSADDWLIQLCNQTNFNKHNKLSQQVRINSPEATVTVGNLLKMSGNSSVTFSNTTYNGKLIGDGRSVTISDTMRAKDIQDSMKLQIPVNKEFEWVEFMFENSTSDTLKLIKKSYQEIFTYIEELKNKF